MEVQEAQIKKFKETFLNLRDEDIEEIVAQCQRDWKLNTTSTNGIRVRDEFLDQDQFIAYQLAEAAERVKGI